MLRRKKKDNDKTPAAPSTTPASREFLIAQGADDVKYDQDGDRIDDDDDEFRAPTDEKPTKKNIFSRSVANVNSFVDGKHDAVIEKLLNKVLRKVGNVVKEKIKAPYMPAALSDRVDDLFERVWDEVDDELRDDLMQTYGRKEKKYRELRLNQWAPAPPLWSPGDALPNPYAWFRAKVLYSTQPADATIWKVTTDPICATILVIKLCPLYGVNVLIFALLFLFIDKRDEYQLVRFILSFKGFQFISAVLMAAKTGIKTFFCLQKMEAMLTPDLDYLGWSCSPVKPTPKSAYIYSLEILRVVLLTAAGYLLTHGYAYGGVLEVKALEEVRLDVADGSLDGVAERSKLRSNAGATGAYIKLVDDDDVYAATMYWRKKLRVPKCNGYMLPRFMEYDRKVVTALGIIGFGFIWSLGLTPDDWMFWTTLFYMKMMWGLLSLPFLLFSLPLIGKALHHAKTTAYDQSGVLVPKLSATLMKRKKKLDEDKLAKLAKGERKLQKKVSPDLTPDAIASIEADPRADEAASKLGASVRGHQARKKLTTSRGLPTTNSTLRWFVECYASCERRLFPATVAERELLDAISWDVREQGVVRVTAVRGAGLPAKDKGGTSDPYLKISLHGVVRRSKVVKKSLNPEWNETLEFKGRLCDLLGKPNAPRLMKVAAWDHDGHFDLDDSLGRATVDLEPILRSREPADFVVPLVQRGEGQEGIIDLKVHWLTREELKAEEAAEATALEAAAPSPASAKKKGRSTASRQTQPASSRQASESSESQREPAQLVGVEAV